ncbi:hypothetical protein TanjilG_30421 [Lupinus angustifolius]|nr:hypothetical protein TanjilG_30421 [Lupinus angustifolius]
MIPSLCTSHFQRAQNNLSSTFKKTALNVSSTSKITPKLHIILAEYIPHFQVKRRKGTKGKQKVKL